MPSVVYCPAAHDTTASLTRLGVEFDVFSQMFEGKGVICKELSVEFDMFSHTFESGKIEVVCTEGSVEFNEFSGTIALLLVSFSDIIPFPQDCRICVDRHWLESALNWLK